MLIGWKQTSDVKSVFVCSHFFLVQSSNWKALITQSDHSCHGNQADLPDGRRSLGVHYLWWKRLRITPQDFQGKQTSVLFMRMLAVRPANLDDCIVADTCRWPWIGFAVYIVVLMHASTLINYQLTPQLILKVHVQKACNLCWCLAIHKCTVKHCILRKVMRC